MAQPKSQYARNKTLETRQVQSVQDRQDSFKCIRRRRVECSKYTFQHHYGKHNSRALHRPDLCLFRWRGNLNVKLCHCPPEHPFRSELPLDHHHREDRYRCPTKLVRSYDDRRRHHLLQRRKHRLLVARIRSSIRQQRDHRHRCLHGILTCRRWRDASRFKRMHPIRPRFCGENDSSTRPRTPPPVANFLPTS